MCDPPRRCKTSSAGSAGPHIAGFDQGDEEHAAQRLHAHVLRRHQRQHVLARQHIRPARPRVTFIVGAGRMPADIYTHLHKSCNSGLLHLHFHGSTDGLRARARRRRRGVMPAKTNHHMRDCPVQTWWQHVPACRHVVILQGLAKWAPEGLYTSREPGWSMSWDGQEAPRDHLAASQVAGLEGAGSRAGRQAHDSRVRRRAERGPANTRRPPGRLDLLGAVRGHGAGRAAHRMTFWYTSPFSQLSRPGTADTSPPRKLRSKLMSGTSTSAICDPTPHAPLSACGGARRPHRPACNSAFVPAILRTHAALSACEMCIGRMRRRTAAAETSLQKRS